jgi:DNA invertase Pin-like site-specific DNA recombinase
MSKKTALVYCRTSTQGQRQAETIGAQVERCRALVARHDLTLLPYGPGGDGWILDDGVTGTLLDGRQFSKLLEDLRTGAIAPDYLVIYSLSRIARVDRVSKNQGKVLESHVAAAKIQATLISSGTHIIDEEGVMNPGDMLFQFKSMMANEEFKLIRSRTMSGKSRRMAEGCFAKGGKPPYGYVQVPVNGIDRKQGWRLEVQPEDAANLARLLDWYIEGGVTHAARMATEARIPTPMASTNSRKNQAKDWSPVRWSPVSVQHIIRNSPAYLGSTTYSLDGEVYPLTYPALITPTLYAAIQKRKGERTLKRRATKLSTGFVDCKCGAHLHNRNSHGRHFTACEPCRRRMPEQHFERHLWTAAVCRLIQIRQHEGGLQADDGLEGRIQALKQQLEAHKEKGQRLITLYTDGQITRDDYREANDRIRGQRAKLEAELAQRLAARSAAQQRRAAEATVEARLRSTIAELSLKTPSLDRKREVLRDVLNGARVVVGWLEDGVTLTLPAFGTLPQITVSSERTIWNDMLGGMVAGHHVSTQHVGKGVEASELALLASVTSQGGQVVARQQQADGAVVLRVEVPDSYAPA